MKKIFSWSHYCEVGVPSLARGPREFTNLDVSAGIDEFHALLSFTPNKSSQAKVYDIDLNTSTPDHNFTYKSLIPGPEYRSFKNIPIKKANGETRITLSVICDDICKLKYFDNVPSNMP